MALQRRLDRRLREPHRGGDFNGDGQQDTANGTAASGVKVRLGTGSGTFGAQTTVAVATAVAAIRTTDLDGNGALDLVWLPQTPEVDVLYYAFGTGTGTFGAAQSVSVPFTSGIGLAVGDVDANGRGDIVVGNFTGGANAIALYQTNVSGVPQAPTLYGPALSVSAPSWPTSTATAASTSWPPSTRTTRSPSAWPPAPWGRSPPR